MAFNTAYDLDSLVVATKAATVYTAQENSLFLGGGLIPMVNLPAGSISAQIPVMGSVTASKLTSASHDATDFDALGIADTKVTITANIYAARDVMRDLGAIDPAELGRVLGQSVAKAFDTDVITAMNSLTASTSDSDPMTVDAIFNAAADADVVIVDRRVSHATTIPLRVFVRQRRIPIQDFVERNKGRFLEMLRSRFG